MDGAAAVGLAAVSAAARSEDGRGPKTELERLVPAHFGLDSPVALARAIESGSDPDGAGWASSRRSCSSAADTDAVAGEIVDRQAAEVVAFVRAAANRLDLAGAGGRGRARRQRAAVREPSGSSRGIEAGLREVGPRLSPVVARSRPIVGAVLTGLDRLGAEPDAYERAREELDRATASVGDVAGDAAAVPELP